jgi:hypothetical protein
MLAYFPGISTFYTYYQICDKMSPKVVNLEGTVSPEICTRWAHRQIDWLKLSDGKRSAQLSFLGA